MYLCEYFYFLRGADGIASREIGDLRRGEYPFDNHSVERFEHERQAFLKSEDPAHFLPLQMFLLDIRNMHVAFASLRA